MLHQKFALSIIKPPSESPTGKKKSNLSNSSAFATLQAAINVFKEIAGNTGVPGLQDGVKALSTILDVIQKTSQNADDMESFAKRIEGLTAMLQKVLDPEGAMSKAMQDRIQRLFRTWQLSASKVEDIGSKNYVKRALKRDIDARAIKGEVEEITWSIHSFMVESMLAVEFALDKTNYLLQQSTARVENKLENIHRDVQNIRWTQNVHGGTIPRAITARFDCNDKLQPCHDGTRKDVLAKIRRWIDADTSSPETNTLPDLDKTDTARVFWLNGPGSAGTGKTTIAYTVATDLHQQAKLGASFFCSRDNAECSDPKLIFPTIAYQLGQFYAPFYEELATVIRADPEVSHSVVPLQLERLIVKPLRALRGTMPSCVVVIDALDECQTNGATSIILASLAQYILELYPLKFLITSRPDHSVAAGFEVAKLSQVTQRFILHEVERRAVETDIHIFLQSSLKATGRLYKLEGHWPSAQELTALVQLSSGLFIFASTAAKLIQDTYYNDPRGQLARILGEIAVVDSTSYQLLDQLYMQVLTIAIPSLSEEFASRLKIALGSIVLLRSPLSPSAIENLLGLGIPLSVTLRYLHSVVIFPTNQGDAIRLIHPSFYDFLVDPARCKNPSFLVNPELQHSLLAQACLNALNMLNQDVSVGYSPWKIHAEVEDFSELVQARVSPVMQYACSHWAFHLSSGLISDALLSSLEQFCQNYILYWIEICSMLGELRGVFLSLKAVLESLYSVGKNNEDCALLLHDCQRFVGEFFPALSVASSQMYLSAPGFTPLNSKLLSTYQSKFKHSLILLHHGDHPHNWQACLRTITGHSSFYSVAFSPDNQHVASASSDHTLQLWNAVTGALIKNLLGHSHAVTSVVFSKDGAYLLSGSMDSTTRLWDAITGGLLKTFQVNNVVNAVAISPAGDYIISGSADRNLWLHRPFEAWPELHDRRLRGHKKSVTSVDISPDGTLIVSGSLDKSIWLWNSATSKKIHNFKGTSAPITSVAFSNNGTTIVSCDEKNTICIWSVGSGSKMRSWKGNSRVFDISYSPNDAFLLLALEDNSVQLWNSKNGTCLKTLLGHTGSVVSATFSSDSTEIISASRDNTIKIWDAVSEVAQKNTSMAVSAPVVCNFSVSPDGKYIGVAMSNHTVELWSCSNGKLLRTMKGHTGHIKSVTFSPDGSQLASVSTDKDLHFWDITSGSCLHIFKGHLDVVETVKFTVNGLQIVSGSYDKTVIIWDIATHKLLKTFTGHTDCVSHVAVSDGVWIASASKDRTARVWDLSDGKHIHTLRGHTRALYGVAFSLGSKFIASGSYDNTVMLWDVATGVNIRVLNHDNNLNGLAHPQIHFSPNPKILVISTACLATGLDPEMAEQPQTMVDLDRYPSLYIDDGWIVAINTRRRICWIPQNYRGRMVPTEKGIALITPAPANNLVILDFTKLVSYHDSFE